MEKYLCIYTSAFLLIVHVYAFVKLSQLSIVAQVSDVAHV